MVTIEELTPESLDVGAVAHYGDPHREQRSLGEGAGLVDRSHRGVIALTGEDRLTYLHNITTQHLTGLPPWTGTETLFLSPHGHIEHHALITDDGTTTWLDVEPGTVVDLHRFLDRMRFMMRVEPVDVSADWAVLTLAGPQAAPVLAALGVTLADPRVAAVPGPKFPSGTVAPHTTSGYAVSPLPTGGWARSGVAGVDLLIPRSTVPDVWGRLIDAGATPVGHWAYEAHRVAARRPRLGFETDHRTLPSEVDLMATAVHLDKGCYRGQETVARVHNLGRPPRRLALLHLDGIATDHPPAPGTPVTLEDGREIGFVGTATRHYELGMIALAVLKRSTPDDAVLRVGESSAAIDLP
ncbi:folate-binding protein YgfZ [Allocatelliglobosispora scoriae]|uniref:Folate-binding protein YgfZ n=1 Tax=Allocatelliglobosispora scoriae TaxID=643052 RepID=A0A841BSE2_9ACTN|nr:folate-binding protein YgfZ [Allocatelliglobosispora scoriae]